jgi:hypothetical protein
LASVSGTPAFSVIPFVGMVVVVAVIVIMIMVVVMVPVSW